MENNVAIVKKYVFSAILGLLLSPLAYAQVFVNGVNINELDIAYCQLIAVDPGLIGNAIIRIDYGQPRPMVKRPDISGPDKQLVRFNSVVDALNFMVRNGWELVSSQITANKEGSSEEFIYLLRKRDTPIVR